MRFGTLLFLILTTGCSSLTEPDRVRILGAIDGYNQDDPQIEIVQDGRDVTVRVTTYGDGCYSQGETDAVVEGLEADVTPWDYTEAPGSDVFCTLQLVSFTHEAVLHFDVGGTALIRVHGIDASTGSFDSRGERITVERSVEVP